QPGKKLLFMGGEFGQRGEWQHDASLDWHTVDYLPQAGLQQWVRDLNRAYRNEPALHELACNPAGFEWIDASDADNSTLCWLRKPAAPLPLGGGEGNVKGTDCIAIICNFTPVPRSQFRVGVPFGGFWKEILNSDAQDYWGSGQG